MTNRKLYKHGILLVVSGLFILSLASAQQNIAIAKNEHWWMGIISHGSIQPLKSGYKADLNGNLYGNQAQPLLLSDQGRIIWSEDPFAAEVRNDSIFLTTSSGECIVKKVADNLRGAFLYASQNYFPPAGALPAKIMFQNPQYNTWIELLHNQNQQDVLNYASKIIKTGLPPGVIMIDDNWQEDYGKWDFHPGRFTDPKAMMDSLHHMGFRVMLWICPFISADSENGRMLETKKAVLRTTSGETKMIHWWNGYSSVLDLTNPYAKEWLINQLHYLQNEYGIDGFKFDAGDPEYYVDGLATVNITPNRQTELFSEIGRAFPLNEYRATWKMGGQPLAQRLRDKSHSWKDLQSLIPDILLQGIMGYPFTCPDMIGGGEMGSFVNLDKVDQELIVRSAQCHVFMPMMQFSVAPWRVLDSLHFNAVKQAIAIRMQYSDLILELAEKAAKSGEPVVRSMEYVFPHCGYAEVSDQFLLGDRLLVAPFVTKSDYREVAIPPGKWVDDKGKIINGPCLIKEVSELDRIPHYKKLK
ncbi:MAG TPA: glycoside hydrolase family 31 protein [Bacteroidales bacterium]|nr:glycoside hydrolase family 31 protein [Bacteroidales bacterium]